MTSRFFNTAKTVSSGLSWLRLIALSEKSVLSCKVVLLADQSTCMSNRYWSEWKMERMHKRLLQQSV